MEGDTFTAEEVNSTPTPAATGATADQPGATATPASSEPNTDAASQAPADNGDHAADQQNPGDNPAADDQKAKPANGFQKRIDELTRDKYEAQRDADYWRGVAEGRIKPDQPAQQQQPSQQQEVLPPGLPPKPVFTMEAYNGDYDKYVEDLSAWSFRKEQLNAQLTEQQREQQTKAQEAVNSHFERVDQARTTMPDFDQVLDSTTVQIHNKLIPDIVASENSAELMYYLAKNPQEAEKLNSLSHTEALRELGRIEGRMSAQSSSTTTPAPVEQKRVSSAPEPVNPIGTRGTATKNPDDMTMEEYAAYEKDRERKRQENLKRK